MKHYQTIIALNNSELKKTANKNYRLLLFMTIVSSYFLLSSILKFNFYYMFASIGSFIPCNALYGNYIFAKKLISERN